MLWRFSLNTMFFLTGYLFGYYIGAEAERDRRYWGTR